MQVILRTVNVGFFLFLTRIFPVEFSPLKEQTELLCSENIFENEQLKSEHCKCNEMRECLTSKEAELQHQQKINNDFITNSLAIKKSFFNENGRHNTE